MGYYVKVEPSVSVFVEDLNPRSEKAILFLHGWPANHKMFEYQLNQLPKQGYRCIGMDVRGFGKSDKPVTGYDYNRLADDVRAVVDTLQLRNITLVGHSTGGSIAVRYMARHGGHGVSKLVLLATAAPSLIERPYFPYGLKRDAVLEIIKGTFTDRPKMLQDFGKMFFYQSISEPFSSWFFHLGLEAASWSTAAVANTWLYEEQLFYDLTTIRVPTLILHGIHDQVCLFPLAHAQKQSIPNSRLIPFDHSGHGLFWEEREKVNREIVAFVG
ncbi:alpha/beta hydrolase [Robertmurraya korlensis]|uniref:alpha/beta fold hydrolase n=1 Tax=Robertmurraya korlensis TaxID=519977 RepID=UPI00203B8D8B|nr:alpha/beta hydrolase [Robertmurraya korlensis]